MRLVPAVFIFFGFFLGAPDAGAEVFAPAPLQSEVKSEWVKKGGCLQRKVSLLGHEPVTGLQSWVEADEWVPRKANPASERAVLVVPPTGGVTLLDEGWAQRICRRGVKAILLRHWIGDLETGLEPSVHDRGSLRGVWAIRLAVSYLQEPRLSILGTSLGAILTAMALGVEPRLDRGLLVVAGGSVSDLMTESDQELLVKMRDDRMKAYGLHSLEEYRAFLQRYLTIEPLAFAAPSAGKRLKFYIGTADTTVPTHTQIELWRAWGSPERVDVPHGHLGTILKAWAFHRDAIADFLVRND